MKCFLTPPSTYRLSQVLLLAGLVLTFFLPNNYFYQSTPFTPTDNSPSVSPVEVLEDRVGIVSVYQLKALGEHHIRIFRTPTAKLFDDIKRHTDWGMEEIFDFDRGFRPKRVLVIGLGGAMWLPKLTSYDFVEEIVIVELSEKVVDAVRKYSPRVVQEAFDSQKVKIIIADGRRYLNSIQLKKERFDFIQLGVFQPWMSGSGNLYSKEFLAQIKDVLPPDGILATIDLSIIAETALEVFDRCIFFQKIGHYLYFTDKEIEKLQIPETFKIQTQTKDSLHLLDERGGTVCIKKAFDIQKFGINTDDRPIMEYWFLKAQQFPNKMAYWMYLNKSFRRSFNAQCQ